MKASCVFAPRVWSANAWREDAQSTHTQPCVWESTQGFPTHKAVWESTHFPTQPCVWESRRLRQASPFGLTKQLMPTPRGRRPSSTSLRLAHHKRNGLDDEWSQMSLTKMSLIPPTTRTDGRARARRRCVRAVLSRSGQIGSESCVISRDQPT